jgi:hypothetical protein
LELVELAQCEAKILCSLLSLQKAVVAQVMELIVTADQVAVVAHRLSLQRLEQVQQVKVSMVVTETPLMVLLLEVVVLVRQGSQVAVSPVVMVVLAFSLLRGRHLQAQA